VEVVRDQNSLFKPIESDLPEEVQLAHVLRDGGAAKVDRVALTIEMQCEVKDLTFAEGSAVTKLVMNHSFKVVS
jgi:hypothetical protein